MTRTTWQTLAITGLVSIVACSDNKPMPSAAPSPPASLVVLPPEEGQPDYYEYETTISGTGGLPGWIRPDESHARTLKEIHRWSYTQGYWQLDNQFPTPERQFSGFVQSADVDVAYSQKRRNSFMATNRTGLTLSSSSRPPIDLVQQGSGPSANVLTPLATLVRNSASVPGSVRKDAPTFETAEVRASRADRVVLSRGGKSRELALLHRQFGDGMRRSDGMLEYKKTHGNRELRLHFNPAIGAVTRILTYEGNTRRVEIERRYKQQEGVWVLASVETQTFDSAGKSVSRFSQSIHSVNMK